MYIPTIWDWTTFLGTIALFITLFLTFVRLLPSISMFEMKQILQKPEVSING
jgi:molybdopterin-containing oxidoreductase family membrane subunit